METNTSRPALSPWLYQWARRGASFYVHHPYLLANLLLAYHKESKGKRGHPNVAEFERHLEYNLLELQRELRGFTYLPGTYTSFYIHEPKKRLISAAPFCDRFVHHALCSCITDSYANRIGKVTHRAINRAQEFARLYRCYLQIDLRQFFPSIDHAIIESVRCTFERI